ncbi:EamA/RhaT family transporter, partial [Pectobacterium versatile]|nr:EamA/RhaT family transporter [Pectobacterium versatile]
ILVTLSLRYTDASLLAPFDYTTLVWSMMIGYLFLNNVPGPATLLGASIVALAGIFTLWCDQRRARIMHSTS